MNERKAKIPRAKWTYRFARRELAKEEAREQGIHVSKLKGWRLSGSRKDERNNP